MGKKSRSKKEFREAVNAVLRRPPSVSENLRWGITHGLGMAAFLSLAVILMSLGRGSFYYERYGVSAWSAVLSYLVSGFVAGATVGFLRPRLRTRRAAAVVGMLAGTIFYGSAGLLVLGPHLHTVVVALVLGCAVGGVLGYRWSDPREYFNELEPRLQHSQAILEVSRRSKGRR